MKQRISSQIRVVGDGVSTTFTFDLGKVYGLHFAKGNSPADVELSVLNADAIPDEVEVGTASTGSAPVSASLSRRAITFTFSPAPGVGSENVFAFSILFNG